jgi:hypothetical protein
MDRWWGQDTTMGSARGLFGVLGMGIRAGGRGESRVLGVGSAWERCVRQVAS